MTVSIEYEAEKKLDLPYEKIIKEIVEASLDFEKCPYEAEVSLVLTTDEEIRKTLAGKVKTINTQMPKYKAIRGIILTEEPLIKTTTNKIKRQANLDEINKSEN